MPLICSRMPTMQSHQRRTRSHKNSCHACFLRTQMSNTKHLFTFVLLLGSLIAATNAVDEKTIKPASLSSSASASSSSATLSTHRDEIYIDDEGIEGSGGRGEIHDDLEKDPDYSGSGFGPDDEDSSTDHHQSIGNSGKSQHTNDNDFISSRTSNSGTIIGSSGGNTGSTGIVDSTNTGINSIGKDHQEHHHQETPLQQHNDNNLNNHPSTQHTTTSTSSSLPPSKPNDPANIPPHSPSPTLPRHDDDDDDDFDLDETIVEASGDGSDDRDDDDETGDDDIDQDIIARVHQTHDLDAAKTNVDDDHDIDRDRDDNDDIETEIDGGTDIDDEIKHHIHPYQPNLEEDRKQDNGDSDLDIDDQNKDKKIVDGDVDGDNNDNDDEEDGNDDDAGTDVYTDATVTNEGAPKRPGTNQGTIHELDSTNVNSLPTDTKIEHTTGNEVLIMSDDDRTTSFFAQPGILAAVIGGAVVGLLCAILVVMFIVYRMRKKDEGSYALDEPKRSPAVNSYAKNANNREFYA